MPDEYESPIGQRPEITGAVVPPVPRHDPYAAFRSRGFRFFTTGNLLSILGRQMLAVAVEWEIYRRTHSATALGLVGLVFAIPIVGLSLPAGHLADRISRKHIILVSQIFSSVTSALLALVSWQHLAIPQMSILRACNHGLSAVADVFERHQSGFHFDDASIPLIYLLLFLGAIGISGDGVDQDDIVGASGTHDFLAPNAIRSDQFNFRGTRLPYAKFPRDPTL